MKKFPYTESDLIEKKEFIRYCIKRNCTINDNFLELLEKGGFISALLKKKENENAKDKSMFYSKYQFYIIQRILDERYKNIFFTNLFGSNSDISYYSSQIQKQFNDFDTHFFEILYPGYIDFFNLFYQLKGQYQDFYKNYFEGLYSIVDKYGGNINELHANRTVYKNHIKLFQDQNIKKSFTYEKNIIDTFTIPILVKYKGYFKVYEKIKNDKNFLRIPDFQIVRDFTEDILLIIEWFNDTIGIKNNRNITKYSLSDTCIICGKNFKKIRWSQKTCCIDCSKIYKKNYKNERRKVDKGYGRSRKEAETVTTLLRKISVKDKYIDELENKIRELNG